MRSTFRLFMAAILLTVAAGFASAQESSEPPPPPAPDAAVPVAELPPIPDPRRRAPRPGPERTGRRPRASTIDPSALAVAPAAVAIAEPPAPEKPVVTTTTKRVTKKTVKKPVGKPAVEANGIPRRRSRGGTAAVAHGRKPACRSGRRGEHGARQERRAPAACSRIGGRRDSCRGHRASDRSMGIGGWLLAGIVVVAMFGLITWFRRRRTQRKTSIVEFPQFSPELKPLPVSRF